MIGAFDFGSETGDGRAVTEMRDRVAMRTYQRKENPRDPGIIDALLMQKKFNLQQHPDFLFRGVVSEQNDFEWIDIGVAGRRFRYKLDRHKNPDLIGYFFILQPSR